MGNVQCRLFGSPAWFIMDMTLNLFFSMVWILLWLLNVSKMNHVSLWAPGWRYWKMLESLGDGADRGP